MIRFIPTRSVSDLPDPPPYYEIGQRVNELICIRNEVERFATIKARKVTWQRSDGSTFITYYDTTKI